MISHGRKVFYPNFCFLFKEYTDVLFVAGGVNPLKDYDYLYDAGVAAVLDPEQAFH